METTSSTQGKLARPNITRHLIAFVALLAAPLGFALTGQAGSAAAANDIAAVRAATARFQRVEVAQSEGYGPFLDCFERPGVGGMGYHYVNFEIVDLTIDPLEPEAMVYAPGPQGQLKLGAVEYIVPIDAWDEEYDQPPSLFGLTFSRNETLGVYTLHLWAWKHNSLGIFNDWNPDVSCPH